MHWSPEYAGAAKYITQVAPNWWTAGAQFFSSSGVWTCHAGRRTSASLGVPRAQLLNAVAAAVGTSGQSSVP